MRSIASVPPLARKGASLLVLVSESEGPSFCKAFRKAVRI